MNLAMFVSGRGSNLQAIINAIDSSELTNTEISVVISNNSKAMALKRAELASIPTYILYSSDMKYRAIKILKKHKVDLIVLAGFSRKICDVVVDAFPIINIHPALLPKYGGYGWIGKKVHEHVLSSSDVETGATVHWVDKEFDHGPIIKQSKVSILCDDTVEILSKRVLKVEHVLLVDVLKNFADNFKW